MEQKKNNPGYELLLALASFIWGVAVVAQKTGIAATGPFTFSAVRCLLAALVLIPVIFLFSGRKIREMGKRDPEQKKAYIKNSLVTGLICGVLLFAAISFQQFGLLTTSAGKGGFLTAVYIVLVPVLSIFLGNRAGLKVWLSVALALAGMFLLCIKSGEDLTLQQGDILLLMCAFMFSIHIITVDRLGVKGDGVIISMMQFLVCGLISLVLMFIFEEPTVEGIMEAKIPILYAGIMSGGIAYTIQIIGQAKVQPAVASLFMSLESVFAALAGFVLLGERMTGRELTGCVIMFAAVLLSQLPDRKAAERAADAKDRQEINAEAEQIQDTD